MLLYNFKTCNADGNRETQQYNLSFETKVVPIKEWFEQISDPLSQCVQPNLEPPKGLYLTYIMFHMIYS